MAKSGTRVRIMIINAKIKPIIAIPVLRYAQIQDCYDQNHPPDYIFKNSFLCISKGIVPKFICLPEDNNY